MLAPTGESGHVMTSLVGVYAAARQLEDACKVFDEMLTRAVAAWNCMLAAYVQCGEVDAALRFFWRDAQEGHGGMDDHDWWVHECWEGSRGGGPVLEDEKGACQG